MDELNKWYQNPITYSEADAILQENFSGIKRSFVAVGYYLKRIRDDELFRDGGYESVWDYAEERFGIKRTTASRWMAINDKFSEGGNSPSLAERYTDFGKGQLQEMLYLEEEQLDKITPDMTVKEIREVRAPEKKLVNPDQNQTEYLNAFARYFIDCKHDWLLKDFQNRVMNVSKSPVEIKNHLGVDNRTWHFAVDNGVAHINLFDDYVQLWGENNMYIGNFDWFYLAAALQRMWNIVAMENAEKKQNTECATSHKTGTCIHRPEFACTLSEASKLAVGDGIDCNVKCCWDCPKRIDCGYRCNSAAGHPIEEEQPESVTDLIENPTDETVIDAEYEEIAAENAENEEICCQKAADLDDLTFSRIAIRDYLEEEEHTLTEYERVNSEDGGLPHSLMMRQRMLVKALRLLMENEKEQDEQEDDDEQEAPEPVQPELPLLRNNDQRKEWLNSYKEWPVWFSVPEASEVYHRFDLPDGSSVVICEYHMWLSWKERYSNENPDSIGTREYLLKPGYRYLQDCRTNISALVEHLKDIQNPGKKNGEKR